QAEDGIRYFHVTGVQTCALPICLLACTAFVPLEDVMAFLNKKRTLDDFVPEQRESLEQAIADLKAAPLYVAEASDLRGGITDVMATIVDVRSRYGADQKFVVFVDYLQLLVRDAHHTVEEVTNYTRELKLMAGRMDV